MSDKLARGFPSSGNNHGCASGEQGRGTSVTPGSGVGGCTAAASSRFSRMPSVTICTSLAKGFDCGLSPMRQA
jgi:hypothetical protein